MPERTGYAHGVPSWIDLATTDTDAAKSFYGTVFGWNSMPVGEDEGTPYTMFTKGGKVVAGMGELMPEQVEAGTPPMWSTYINVDDVDATIDEVKEAGGAVVVDAMDIMDTGRMAFVADCTGAAFGLWQLGTHTGAQLANEHGSFTWNELITDDTESAEDFYKRVFGYRTEVADTPNGPYTAFWADGNVEGHAAAGMMGRPPTIGPEVPSYWGVYFAVNDVDASVATIESNDGSVFVPPMDLPGVGRMAVVADPQGAMFSIIELVNEQR